MKDYLKMSDGFDADEAAIEQRLFSGIICKEEATYAAHAIASHDELVEMNKELLKLVSEMLNSGTFFISAVESDNFDVDFSDWEKRASGLVSEYKLVAE